jgi:predicted protein tyrosine phosphatase
MTQHRALLRHEPLHVLDIPNDDRCLDAALAALLGNPVADLPGLER